MIPKVVTADTHGPFTRPTVLAGEEIHYWAGGIIKWTFFWHCARDLFLISRTERIDRWMDGRMDSSAAQANKQTGKLPVRFLAAYSSR